MRPLVTKVTGAHVLITVDSATQTAPSVFHWDGARAGSVCESSLSRSSIWYFAPSVYSVCVCARARCVQSCEQRVQLAFPLGAWYGTEAESMCVNKTGSAFKELSSGRAESEAMPGCTFQSQEGEMHGPHLGSAGGALGKGTAVGTFVRTSELMSL